MQDRKIKWLSVIFGLQLAVCSEVAFASLPTPSSDPISAALEKGDANVLFRIEDKLNVHSDSRALNDAQLHYDVPNLLRLAIHFEDERFKRNTPGDLLLALRANRLARASALSLGDANTYLKEALRAREILLPALTKSIGGVNTFDNGLDTADLEGALRNAPKVSVSWRSAAATFQFPSVSAMSSKESGPRPSMKVGDRIVAATIATDRSTITPLWIITSASDQRSLGLTLLVKNIGKANASYRSRGYTAQMDLYLAPSVQFGPLVLHNVAVVVMQTDFVPPATVVGMPMLRQFAEVTFGDRQMTVARTSSDTCKSGAPLLFASGPDLDGASVFPASINGKSALANIVLDNPAVVAVRPDFSDAVSNGKQVDFAVGSWSLQHQTAVVPSSWASSQDAALTGGVLKNNTVSLRFDTPKPSVCIAKATQS